MADAMITRAALRFSAFFKTVAIAANAVGTLMVLLLMVAMNFDVVARNGFNAPYPGVVEMVVFSLILIVFLQLPDVVRVNRLTRSDGFLLILAARMPVAAGILSRLIDGLALIVMATITYAIWPEFVDSFESCNYFTQPEFGPPPTGNLFVDLREATARCHYFGTLGVFTLPWWPAHLAIAFSAALCTFLYLLKTLFGLDHERPADGSDLEDQVEKEREAGS
jgi:TRAP-type C4-dicarboxylate transport system permease small subunit